MGLKTQAGERELELGRLLDGGHGRVWETSWTTFAGSLDIARNDTTIKSATSLHQYEEGGGERVGKEVSYGRTSSYNSLLQKEKSIVPVLQRYTTRYWQRVGIICTVRVVLVRLLLCGLLGSAAILGLFLLHGHLCNAGRFLLCRDCGFGRVIVGSAGGGRIPLDMIIRFRRRDG